MAIKKKNNGTYAVDYPKTISESLKDTVKGKGQAFDNLRGAVNSAKKNIPDLIKGKTTLKELKGKEDARLKMTQRMNNIIGGK